MRVRAILAALALVTAPAFVAPTAAYADGIERPRPPRQRVRRPQPPPPPAPLPPPPIVETGPEVVTLNNSFFAGSSGGVGADIGAGSYSSTTVIIRGTNASASAFAFASARSSAGARGGYRGGGHGCGCR